MRGNSICASGAAEGDLVKKEDEWEEKSAKTIR